MYIYFKDGEILVQQKVNEIIFPVLPSDHLYSKGYVKVNDDVTAYEVSDDFQPPEETTFFTLRNLLPIISPEQFNFIGRAFTLNNWNNNTKHCGRCGSLTKQKIDEVAKECPNCNYVQYPQICPAIIVSVVREDRILLASSVRFKSKLFSVLAGFVEAGESFEECVSREVYEETKIKVKNVKYFGSQPWPFPNSLMVGFTAEYESGEVELDYNELSEFGWFTKNDLPENLPGKLSIARALIENFRNS